MFYFFLFMSSLENDQGQTEKRSKKDKSKHFKETFPRDVSELESEELFVFCLN